MARSKQWVREVRIVAETPDGNFARSDIHMMDRITEALARVNNVNIGIAFFDADTGRRIRKVELNALGESSAEMKKLMEVELGTDEVVA